MSFFCNVWNKLLSNIQPKLNLREVGEEEVWARRKMKKFSEGEEDRGLASPQGRNRESLPEGLKFGNVWSGLDPVLTGEDGESVCIPTQVLAFCVFLLSSPGSFPKFDVEIPTYLRHFLKIPKKFSKFGSVLLGHKPGHLSHKHSLTFIPRGNAVCIVALPHRDLKNGDALPCVVTGIGWELLS